MTNRNLVKTWTIIGFLFNLGYCIGSSIYFYNAYPSDCYVAIMIFAVLTIFNISFFIAGMSSLNSDDKTITMGILILLFVSLIGGILYLCWQPYHKEEIKNDNQNINYSLMKENPSSDDNVVNRPIIKETKNEDPYENLKKLKDLLDKGIIDQKTYDEKSKKYIDML